MKVFDFDSRERAERGAPTADATGPPSRSEVALLLAIVLGAVVLRLVTLGHLSFAGDEETTTLAALALLDGWPPKLPGGLVYTRGLPFTALESLAIALFGANEFALRLFPVLFAGPRVAGLWWFARPFLGARLALAAAGALALAAFDVEQSRNARMYSMFATLDLLAIAAAVHTALGARRTRTAVVSGMAAVATHALAITHVVVPVAAALGRGIGRRSRLLLCAIAAALVLAFLGQHVMNSASYAGSGAGVAVEAASRPPTPVAVHLAALHSLLRQPAALLCASLGAAGVALFTLLALPQLGGWLARLGALAAAAAWCAASPVLGVPLVLCTLMFAGIQPREARSQAWTLLAAPLAGCAGWAAAALVAEGPGRAGVEAAARLLLSFPAPNWFEFALAGPGLVALALVGGLVAADRGARGGQPGVWVALLAAAFGPLLISGVIERSEALRYQIHSLGPLIVLVLLGAHALAGRLLRGPRAALAASVLLACAVVRPDYALDAVLRDYGPVDAPFADRVVAADHRGAADFVRAHARAGDWIAAEDALEQHLLIGRTELWLRRSEDAANFLQQDPAGGRPRDIYTGSRQVGDLDELRELARREGQHVVWIVTSGEVEPKPSFYRTDETDALLRTWRPLAWFEGADGLTRVYRLVDGEPEPPQRVSRAETR